VFTSGGCDVDGWDVEMTSVRKSRVFRAGKAVGMGSWPVTRATAVVEMKAAVVNLMVICWPSSAPSPPLRSLPASQKLSACYPLGGSCPESWPLWTAPGGQVVHPFKCCPRPACIPATLLVVQRFVHPCAENSSAFP
jgi:hypothetical protein